MLTEKEKRLRRLLSPFGKRLSSGNENLRFQGSIKTKYLAQVSTDQSNGVPNGTISSIVG